MGLIAADINADDTAPEGKGIKYFAHYISCCWNCILKNMASLYWN